MLLASLFGWQEHASFMPCVPHKQCGHREKEETRHTPIECFGHPMCEVPGCAHVAAMCGGDHKPAGGLENIRKLHAYRHAQRHLQTLSTFAVRDARRNQQTPDAPPRRVVAADSQSFLTACVILGKEATDEIHDSVWPSRVFETREDTSWDGQFSAMF